MIGLVTSIVKLQLESSFKLISCKIDGLFVALQRWESVNAQTVDVHIVLGNCFFNSQLDQQNLIFRKVVALDMF